jgi:predicted Zn-dependent protease
MVRLCRLLDFSLCESYPVDILYQAPLVDLNSFCKFWRSLAMLSLRNACIFLVVFALTFLACSTVPISGRSQLNMIPASQMLSMSLTEYDSFLKSNKLSTDQKQTQTVKSVGARIQKAVEQFMTAEGQKDALANYAWEFNLVESKEVNAWCMPGGKVVFYTGILPITQTESGIAVVMGHEVAHAIAEHGGERMSQQLLAQLGGIALSKALETKPEETRNLWLGVYGLGSQVGVLLPFSRTQESEADHLGLVFMAMAGYDPGEAVSFWQRMAANKNGSAPPELLSTHPSDETRINNLKGLIPEAMKYYKKK